MVEYVCMYIYIYRGSWLVYASARLLLYFGSPRRGAPLSRPGPEGEHLIDEAPLMPLWQVLPVVQPGEASAGSQLASDRR